MAKKFLEDRVKPARQAPAKPIRTRRVEQVSRHVAQSLERVAAALAAIDEEVRRYGSDGIDAELGAEAAELRELHGDLRAIVVKWLPDADPGELHSGPADPSMRQD